MPQNQTKSNLSRIKKTTVIWSETVFLCALFVIGHEHCELQLYAASQETLLEERADTAPQHTYTNRLIHEKSPYLLQHAHNPVDWYPWGEEAFAKAREEDRLIFLSVGYSTCHWCHVMEHESFENPEIAALMNKHYVSIKVDREERPDVDRVYMAFVQATTGSGGWPMSVWLTPELKPIAGGTYFPPEERWGRVGFPTVLKRSAQLWETQREEIIVQSNSIIAALEKSTAVSSSPTTQLDPVLLEKAFTRIAASFDSHQGGFSGAPKFPRPVTLNFLFHYYAWKNPKSEESKRALDMVLFTLRKMADGGIYDHLGGGFHRYSVDRFWHVPHFEKMLYDQAQLANVYLDAYQITQETTLANTARDILDYILRDMTDPQGGFYSAEDADSLPTSESKRKSEGAFYVWTTGEIMELLGREKARVFNYYYGVRENGNAPSGSDPHGEFRDRNILVRSHTLAETVKKYDLSRTQAEKTLHKAREKLLQARNLRPRPHRDDKIITAWNGLMISAYARGSQILQEPAYLQAAIRAATFIEKSLYRAESGVLLRLYRQGPSEIAGYTDDYAFLIQGLLDLYEASLDISWLQWALRLQKKQDKLFYDGQGGGYYSVTGNDPKILLRIKESYDGAEPSPNSVSALNLLRLAQMTNNTAYREQAEKTLKAFGDRLSHAPKAVPQMLVAYDFYQAKPKQIILAGSLQAEGTRRMLREIYRPYLPNKIVLMADGGSGQAFLGQYLEIIKAMEPIDGQTTAFICENYACRLPTSDIKLMAQLLVQ